MTKERIIWIDLLRIFATFAVIVLHAAARDWYVLPTNSFEWNALNIFDSITRWCVPIFIMISGSHFLSPKNIIPTKTLYKKYIYRIVWALFFWALVYGLIPLIIQAFKGGLTIDLNTLILFPFKSIFITPWYHLSFIYIIIGLYILTPLIRIFIANSKKKDIKYLLTIVIIFGATIPLMNILFNTQIIFRIIELNGYIGYFIAGYYLLNYDISKRNKYIIYILGIVSILLTTLITFYLSNINGTPNAAAYNYQLLNVMLSAFALFVWFKQTISKIQFKQKTISIIKYISSCTFGIYLVHDLWLQFFIKINFTAQSFNPLFSVPILAIVVFISSIIVVSIIKKIPFLNKHII